MIRFDNSFAIHICARTDAERTAWANTFGSWFQNFTITQGTGGWVGEQVVETEPVTIVTRWGTPTADEIASWCRVADCFQAAAHQEAVAIQIVAGGRWQSFIVFAGEWDDAIAAITAAFAGGA